jgi:23S rRNA A2030 N6-methylase RlmJ
MVVVNPPYLLDETAGGWLPELRAALGGTRSGHEIISPSAPR